MLLDKTRLELSKISRYIDELKEGYKKDGKKIPNRITEARLIFSPLPAILLLLSPFCHQLHYVALAAFVVVWLTDVLDGQLARRVYGVTKFGHDLDAIVDKILMTLTMLALCIINPWIWIFAGIALMREAFVAKEMWAAKKAEMEDSGAKKADVTPLGKIKTVVMAIAMGLMFLPFRGNVIIVTCTVAGLAIVLSIVSWLDYMLRYERVSKK